MQSRDDWAKSLATHQQVQLYFVIDEMWISEPLPLEENLHFVRETMGIVIHPQGFADLEGIWEGAD